MRELLAHVGRSLLKWWVCVPIVPRARKTLCRADEKEVKRACHPPPTCPRTSDWSPVEKGDTCRNPVAALTMHSVHQKQGLWMTKRNNENFLPGVCWGWPAPVNVSGIPQASWQQVGSLQSAMVEVVIPQKVKNTINQKLSSFFLENPWLNIY